MEIAFAALFGLILGSFGNVCVHRLPRGQSLVHPASHCPKCGARVRPLDNIPVLSWLALGGKCRACRAPIPWRYPLLEALSGAAAAAAMGKWGLSAQGALGFAAAFVFLVLLFTDLETRLLPDTLTLGGAALPLAFGLLAGSDPVPFDALLGAAAGSGLLLFVLLLHYHVRGYYGMGFGDVKLMAMTGACFGFPGMIYPLIGSCLLALLVAVPFILARGKSWQYPVPYGTFLCAASALYLFRP
jgi:leader peptidase (prepilin peptidase)/N-methyltransferase